MPNAPLDAPSNGPQRAPEVRKDSARCRRCKYDLRGLVTSGRCPECGLAIYLSVASHRPQVGGDQTERELERWEWVHNGTWWIGQSVWALLPFALGAGLIPLFAIIAPAGVTVHAIAHWFGMRDFARGLEGLRFEEGDPVGAADMARRVAVVYAVAAIAAFIGLFLSCFASFVGGAHFLLPGLALIPGLGAMILARRAGIGLADALGMRERIPFERVGTIVLWCAVGLWVLTILMFVVASRMAGIELLVLGTTVIASLTLVAALLLHRDVFLRLAIAIPQIEDFSAAAARAARTKPLIIHRSPPTAEDLSPLELDDAPEEPRWRA